MFKKHAIIAKLLALGIIVTLAPGVIFAQGEAVFSDVDSDTQYSEAIKYLKDEGVVEGYPDGTYKPATNINRAEFTKILLEAAHDGGFTGSHCFPDVNDEWFAKYVCTAKDEGVVDGYADGSFRPAESVNFSEAAKIIANTYNLEMGTDDPATWFKKYIEALQNKKAIPLSVEYFDETITRDEMSEIIWRIKVGVDNKATRTFPELEGTGLVQVKSCSELQERYEHVNRDRYPVYYDMMPMDGDLNRSMDMMEETMAVPAMAGASKSSGAEGGGGGFVDDFSSTNLQELGVDEADVIKNDGRYIYLIKDNTVRIVDAHPASTMKELISFQLGPQDESFYPSEMYVDGDTLVAIGTGYVDYPMPINADSSVMSIMPYYGGSKSKVYIVDISDRNKPKVERTVDFDGNYRTSRRIGDTLYVVLNQYANFPRLTTDATSGYFKEYLPKMYDSKTDKVEAIADCGDIRIMPKPRNFNFLITAAIPLKDTAKNVSREVIVGNGDNIYSSANNMYVVSTDWAGPYRSGMGEHSKVYRFALSEGGIEYSAEGEVSGRVLNQFSMDEHAGNFRIATTSTDYINGQNKKSNNLFIMDKDLNPLGAIKNIAPGEQIYSVRFMGDRGYMVTFKNIDPFFVLDLKDPRNPKILGELKIPGFSDYLHPYDENHIIGFGKDVDPEEAAKAQDFIYYTAVEGFKMGLFDVTDPSNPKAMFTEEIGDRGTTSELLYNHKALLFDKEKDLIAFPISVAELPDDQKICKEKTYSTCPDSCQKVCQNSCTYEDGITICDQSCDGPNSCQEDDYSYPETVFTGAYVYGLDLDKGFELKGRITHLNSEEVEDLFRYGYGNWEKNIQRILYIGDTLYTVSQGAVKANDLKDSLREINMIELAESIYNIKFGQPEPFLID